MSIEELIKQKIFVNIQPLDSWDTWVYQILMQDCMSPFFVAFSCIYEDLEFPSYAAAMVHAQEKVNNLLND